MTEVPEHLLRRSRERRKALGLPVPGEEGEGGEEAAPTAEEAAAPAEAEVPAAATEAEAPAAADGGDTEAAAAASGVPRWPRRRAAVTAVATPARAATPARPPKTPTRSPPAC